MANYITKWIQGDRERCFAVAEGVYDSCWKRAGEKKHIFEIVTFFFGSAFTRSLFLSVSLLFKMES